MPRHMVADETRLVELLGKPQRFPKDAGHGRWARGPLAGPFPI